jgi:autoinducer 2-binding protein LuxP
MNITTIRSLLVLIICLFPAVGISSDYFSVREFHQLYPRKGEIAGEFGDIVHGKGRPLPQGAVREPVRISFVYPGRQVSDYWRRSILAFRGRLDEIGLPYRLEEHFSKPAVDFRMQEKQMREALQGDPDYLVFTLDAAKHRRVIERILTKGRPKLILQNITTPLKIWEGKQPFLYVGFDHETGSEMLARYFLQKTGGSGEYAVLFFTRGYVSTMRGDSFIRFMDNYPGMELKASYYTDGNRENARKAALAIIDDNPRLRFIYACATDVAMGAIDALRQTGKVGTIMVNGWGGGSTELTAIQSGDMDVTVMRINDDNGVAMAEAIRLDLVGRGAQVPTIYSGDFALVEKGLGAERLGRIKARAFRYSSGNF